MRAPWQPQFPLADALRNPAFGYVDAPIRVNAIADFTAPEIEKLKLLRPDLVLAFPVSGTRPASFSDPPCGVSSRASMGIDPNSGPMKSPLLLWMHVGQRWTRRGLSMQLLTR